VPIVREHGTSLGNLVPANTRLFSLQVVCALQPFFCLSPSSRTTPPSAILHFLIIIPQMFTQPVSTPPPGHTTSNTPTSPTRTSRLRGLSYLRNYTQNHLLSRDHSSSSSPSVGATPASTNSATSPTATHSFSRSNSRPNSVLTRSLSYDPPTESSPTHEGEDTHRLSLVASLQEPLRSPAPAALPAAVSSSQPIATTVPEDAVAELEVADSTVNTTPGQGQERTEETMTRARAATTGDAAAMAADNLPSIRFSAYYDPRATRPSLTFAPISRTLPTGSEVIRVGRYSERDSQPAVPANTPSYAPVGFKSKVVSRRHCEFWYDQGKWYIKDVKSSSGTFLNHIRLSPPGTESKPFPVNDGDIVQLGIDFKGGEEMIFRCVKMRLELNRGWQNKLNAFK
jgi:E3 ubiquitin-protein ligase DMA1/2